jgi:hypothetical protein
MFLPSTANAVSAQTMGVPQFLERNGLGVITAVTVQVKKGWLNSDAFELYIEITSQNEGPEGIWNGSKLVSLSSVDFRNKLTKNI